MSATAIIPGRLYRVRGSGLDITVIAGHGCDAICHALSHWKPS
jgi:hypothetical protein